MDGFGVPGAPAAGNQPETEMTLMGNTGQIPPAIIGLNPP